MGKAAPIDGTNVLIGRALAVFIVLLSPFFTVLTKDQAGEVISKRHFSTLEVSALGLLHSSHGLQPVVQAALFPGMAVRQLTKVGIGCWAHGPHHHSCDWSKMDAEVIWDKSEIPEEVEDMWHKAVGDKHSLLVAACSVINVGGLAGFVRPVKMVAAGLLLLVAALFYTPSCIMLPTLVFASFMGVMLVLNDLPLSGKSGGVPKKAKHSKARSAQAAPVAAPSPAGGGKAKKGKK